MMEPIETLLFDFGGTLDADGVAWKERFHTLYRAEGLGIAADAFAPIFFAADDPLVGSLSSTAGLSETVTALATNLEAELTRRGAGTEDTGAVNEQNRGQRVASRFLFEASAAFTRNRPILEALKARYRLGIVSNFYGNLEAVCRSAAIAPLFGVMVDSQCVGAEKPDPAIFHVALETLRATPETTVFVGDSLRRDREGARRMGMRFIWIAPQNVQTAETRASAEPPIHATVTRLPDLMKILR
ncbi:MAG TPA: HAD family hydrolase [Hyphomicrobium sp.]|jgi:HAD superfamily hydrolase (TIGR01509 family)|uniref:HAD family hydrolase n=1 Tax=Hyphomicrobium sp. TaxID=82 RepID=UPI002B8C1C03|nr:HAD family hydrolase [Hyphomicrobium sp.]HXE01789.1 HAD family hydrolase [Hyphomicrobium sp.]